MNFPATYAAFPTSLACLHIIELPAHEFMVEDVHLLSTAVNPVRNAYECDPSFGDIGRGNHLPTDLVIAACRRSKVDHLLLHASGV
jgi:hypothetical protein